MNLFKNPFGAEWAVVAEFGATAGLVEVEVNGDWVVDAGSGFGSSEDVDSAKAGSTARLIKTSLTLASS